MIRMTRPALGFTDPDVPELMSASIIEDFRLGPLLPPPQPPLWFGDAYHIALLFFFP